MSLDSSVRKVAQRVLRKIGTPVIVRRVTGTAYNTTTRTMVPSVSDTEWRVRLDDYTDRELLAAGGSILASDRKATGAAADINFAPREKDQIAISDLIYDVRNVVTEMAQHEAGLYVLQLRR